MDLILHCQSETALASHHHSGPHPRTLRSHATWHYFYFRAKHAKRLHRLHLDSNHHGSLLIMSSTYSAPQNADLFNTEKWPEVAW
ncbi:hypothetical protein M378DRAFT_1008979 [Amanita muscaria Koide BX008]|uniref:Uncharacterized protein n=1 Tax=Amanita muscaria (strain Koide BX008) TaxID=946122 RepID=A0A0C2WRL7_AMAMK|nr:hypothetical protein M378DRAFT_1008979 [Amanita muscaria Koide BX008]